jgi:hypothetical protein
VLDAAAEVLDARERTDTGEGSCGAEHRRNGRHSNEDRGDIQVRGP